MTTMPKTSKCEQLREILTQAIFKDKCMLCGSARNNQARFCSQCNALCPKQKPKYDEVLVRVKIRKE